MPMNSKRRNVHSNKPEAMAVREVSADSAVQVKVSLTVTEVIGIVPMERDFPEGNVEINAKIATARAEAVKTILVNKYKINTSRITAEDQGVGDMFTEPDWNRVSVCTIED